MDVWPIGKSAGVINYEHQTIKDRSNCAKNMINMFDFNINTYLDNMENQIQNELSAWPFRYYLIEPENSNLTSIIYKFKYIPTPSDSEYDLSELIQLLAQL